MNIDLFEKYESNVRGYIRSFPTIFVKSKNATMWDHHGKAYIDFFGGAGSLNYGHNDPAIKRAIIDFIERDGVTNALDKATDAKYLFIKKLQETILQPRDLDYKIQFVGPTGTNAVETALKLARKVKERSKIVSFTNAYHGHTLGALAVTGNEFYHDDFYGVPLNVTKMPYDNYFDPTGEGQMDSIDMMRQYYEDASSGYELPAGIVVETIQGEGGINVASVEWLQKLDKMCKDLDILLIVDDIQVGNGRTGNFFSFERAGIKPDIVTISKSIGTGLPMAIVLMRPEIDEWSPGEHTGTFRGNSLAFVAGATALERWDTDEFSKEIVAKGEKVEKRFRAIAERHKDLISDVRGLGMIWGLESEKDEFCNKISEEAFKRGLLAETAGADDQVIKFLAPLTISEAELNQGLDILDESVDAAAAAYQG
ncbi:diaminobutyrate--2-oxoglutarate transaminase [Guyparkeria hydrothermalis]|uniref:diaminobutyrate--2-oxoglutarate transaminase n=1 Tax=Guyparkeria TaxID=2035712 RepID=UPI0018CBFD48|nr:MULTISPECIES: diaminobutyrate--2-oxoglutarate transaminase [Guyparkeria]MCL7751569.1 diaminobutyrate--2-oxoglutarate transaminase [Guyparkeria hydrothermalis]